MVEIIPVSTTLGNCERQMKVMFRRCTNWYSKTKRGYNSRSTGRNTFTSQEETRKHVQGNILLHQRGYAKMYLIFCQNEMAGVLSFNAIEPVNKAAYIGYWLDESLQGQGIMSQSFTGADDTLCPARRYSALRH
ncbi:ribosomal-protein-L7/L12-serine acetyltransferase [Salmonella enterica subsp. enterica]|uniref:Ribosomal-protein-L7/L12-serine acetyltransferase n=1 Tax=Salmonella enterica I TaxID=59201 RepID=A0A3S4IKM2_SALET|nr:ribosomal-protein-L7/L12-serine acetyltransferase [Salmonella enterica subsp. enterica]